MTSTTGCPAGRLGGRRLRAGVVLGASSAAEPTPAGRTATADEHHEVARTVLTRVPRRTTHSRSGRSAWPSCSRAAVSSSSISHECRTSSAVLSAARPLWRCALIAPSETPITSATVVPEGPSGSRGRSPGVAVPEGPESRKDVEPVGARARSRLRRGIRSAGRRAEMPANEVIAVVVTHACGHGASFNGPSAHTRARRLPACSRARPRHLRRTRGRPTTRG